MIAFRSRKSRSPQFDSPRFATYLFSWLRKLVTSVVCLPTTASAGLLSPDSRPSQAPAQRRLVHGKHLQELAMKTCLRRALGWSLGRVFGLVAAVALAAGAA